MVRNLKKVWERVKNDMWLWLWAGLLMRLLVMPFFMNWDFWANTRLVAEYVQGGSLASVYANPLGTFPPLLFWTLGGYFKLVGSFLGSNFGGWVGYKELSALSAVGIFRYMFVLKVIYLVAEMAAGYLLAAMYTGEKRLVIWRGWMLSPVVIYAVYMFTNVDALPLVFVVLGLYLLKKNSGVGASLAMGLAAAYKVFPVLLFPLVVMQAQGMKEKLVRAGVMMLVFVGTQVPAWGFAGYWKNVVFGDNTGSLWSAAITVGNNQAIYIYLLLYVLVVLWFGRKQKSFENFMVAAFGIMGGIFVLTNFHLQWFLWLLPWLVVYGVEVRGVKWENLLLMAAFGVMVILSNVSLNIGMLAPVEPSLWFLGWPVQSWLGERVYWLLGVAQTVLAACLVWMTYRWIERLWGRRASAKT